MMWTLVFVAAVALSVTAEKDYSPEEYEYDDYEENNEDNGQESPVDFSAFKKVTIRSQSQNIRVAAGGTIRLPCMVGHSCIQRHLHVHPGSTKGRVEPRACGRSFCRR